MVGAAVTYLPNSLDRNLIWFEPYFDLVKLLASTLGPHVDRWLSGHALAATKGGTALPHNTWMHPALMSSEYVMWAQQQAVVLR